MGIGMDESMYQAGGIRWGQGWMSLCISLDRIRWGRDG